MASYGLLALDTTPPQIAWGAYVYSKVGGYIDLSYSLDEPSLIGAEFVDNTGLVVQGNLSPGVIRFQLPTGHLWLSGVVTAHVRDELGNEGYPTYPLASELPVAWVVGHAPVAIWAVSEDRTYQFRPIDSAVYRLQLLDKEVE